MYTIFRSFLSIALCSLLVFSLTNNAIANDLTAKEILDRMEKVYASSQSYMDEGVVSILFIPKKEKRRTVKKPFKTAFIRGDHYRFEFSERKTWGKKSKFVLHWDGKEAKTFWDIQNPKVKKLKSLQEGISMSAGISAGSGRSVSTLLMPKSGPHGAFKNFVTLYKPTRVDDEVVDGIECFKIDDPTDYRRLTLWIGKRDLLLRKIYSEQSFDDFDAESTTTYHPKMNVDVPNQMLRFR